MELFKDNSMIAELALHCILAGLIYTNIIKKYILLATYFFLNAKYHSNE